MKQFNNDSYIDQYDDNDNYDNQENQEIFYYTDENGQWEQNTIFNEDGLPLDINGDVQDGEYRFKDDFDYSPFETDDE